MACLNSYLPPYLCGGIYLFSVQVYPATAHHHTYLEVCITERGGHALSLFFALSLFVLFKEALCAIALCKEKE